jgi:tetratricopeptide (TPR) repeat protein
MLAAHSSPLVHAFLVVTLLCVFCPQTRQGESTNAPASGQDHRPASQREAEAEIERLYKQFKELSAQGKNEEALLTLDRILMISESALTSDPLKIALALEVVGQVYQNRGDYVLAEQRYQRSLEIRRQVLGPTDPDVAASLKQLGVLYNRMGDNVRAGAMLEQALEIQEKVLDPYDLRVASSLNNLALIYMKRGDYQHALSLAQRELEIHKKVYGLDHLEVANSLANLGGYYFMADDFERSVPLLEEALKIQEKASDPKAAMTLTTLGSVY